LTDCKIGERLPNDNPNEVKYNVEIIREKFSPRDLKADDVEKHLKEMGLCNACAGGVADLYVNQPTSRCALMARKALDGDSVALKQLKQDPKYCRSTE
jgi:hypothetical protein